MLCDPGIVAEVVDRLMYLLGGCFIGLVLELRWGVASRLLGWKWRRWTD